MAKPALRVLKGNVKTGYDALNVSDFRTIEGLLHPDVVFHVEGREVDYRGRRAVMQFLREFDRRVGGRNVKLLGLATDPTDGRVVSSDRTTKEVRGEVVDHICADSFTFDDDGLIVEGWICHVDGFN